MVVGIYIAIVNVLLVFKLWHDWHAKNVEKRIINHELSAVIDTFIYLVSAYWLFGFSAAGWIISALAYRWIVFDVGFNLINKDKWDHYGKSSWLDRQLTKLGKFHLLPKLLLLALGIILITL